MKVGCCPQSAALNTSEKVLVEASLKKGKFGTFSLIRLDPTPLHRIIEPFFLI